MGILNSFKVVVTRKKRAREKVFHLLYFEKLGKSRYTENDTQNFDTRWIILHLFIHNLRANFISYLDHGSIRSRD